MVVVGATVVLVDVVVLVEVVLVEVAPTDVVVTLDCSATSVDDVVSASAAEQATTSTATTAARRYRFDARRRDMGARQGTDSPNPCVVTHRNEHVMAEIS